MQHCACQHITSGARSPGTQSREVDIILQRKIRVIRFTCSAAVSARLPCASLLQTGSTNNTCFVDQGVVNVLLPLPQPRVSAMASDSEHEEPLLGAQ